MEPDRNEEGLLRSVALQNANSILLARERTEQELVLAKEALERRSEELAHSLALLRATLEATTDGILVINAAGRVSDYNRRFVEMWGISPEVIESIAGLDEIRSLFSRHLKEPNWFYAESRDGRAPSLNGSDVLELADGRIFERFSRIQTVDGKNIGRVWGFRDITERRRTEEASARLAAVVESSDDAIVSKSLDGIIRTWNKGAERLFGYTASEAVGQSILMLIPPELRGDEPRIIERLKKGERIEHYETVRVKKDGTLFDVSLTVSPIKDAGGKVIGASKIARDITDRRRLEDALRREARSSTERRGELERVVNERTASLQEAVAQMEEFSYSVSHDLRAPLRAMQAYASALLEDHASNIDDEGQDYLRRIVSAGVRMDRLTQDVLTYSKIPRTAMHFDRVSLEKLVSDIVQQYARDESRPAEFTLQTPLQEVLAHESLLAQAISNLVDNAVKFSAPDRPQRIHIWTEPRDKEVRLWVEDNGIGIKPEYHERIWGMFERVHPQNRYEGTGIGLAIVRKAVERMNGTIGVVSEEGAGSKFWIQLPAV